MHQVHGLTVKPKAWWLAIGLVFTTTAVTVQSITGDDYDLSTVQELTLSPNPGHDRAVVRIGASLQIDCCSRFSKMGNDILQAWSLVVEHINGARGGLLVNGTRHVIELKILGDYSQKEVTAQNIRGLINRGFSLLLAPYGSGQSEYAARVVNETDNAFLVAPSASKPTVFFQRPRVYGMLPRSGDYLQSAVNIAVQLSPSHRHAAILCEDYGVAKAWASGLRQHLTAFNFTTHKDVLVPHFIGKNNPGELEHLFSEWLAEFNASGVKPFVFAVTYDYETCTKFAKLSEEIDFRKQVSGLFFTTCIDRGGFRDEVGRDTARYVSGVSPWADTLEVRDELIDKTASEFKKIFSSKFTRDPGYVAAAAHGALVTLCWAIERAQSLDVELVRKQFETLNSPESSLNTLYGNVYFDEHGQIAQRMRVIQFKGEGPTLQDLTSASQFVMNMGTCPLGQLLNASNGSCQNASCGVGEEFLPAFQKCGLCRPGTKKGVDDLQCITCEAGTFSSNLGMSECSICKPGTFSRPGRWFCDICIKGYISPLPGQGKCEPCAAGRWSDVAGSTECSACPESMVTPLQGANSPTECVCTANEYLSCRPHGGPMELCEVQFNTSNKFKCAQCKEGFSCSGGKQTITGTDYHAQPVLQQKFYASEDAPYEAYECFEAGELCTGSGEAQCGGGRKGLQCYACDFGLYADFGDACHECMPPSSKFVLLPLAVFLVFPLLLFVYRATSRDRARYTARTALLGTMSMLVSFSQLYAILGSVSITWCEPLNTIFSYLVVLLFDVRMLGPSCYLGYSPYYALYLPGVTVPVILVTAMFIMWSFSKVSRCMEINRDNAVNTLGTVFLALYVGVCKPVFGIFECRGNASAPDTVRMHDGFICFPSAELTSTLPIAVICILVYVVGFVCLYLWVILRAPQKFLASSSFRMKFRFILSRWHPSCWFWGIFVLFRNVLCSLVPSMTADGMLQMLLLIFIIYPVFVVQVRIWPWRDEIANKQDMVLSAALLLTIISGITLQAQNIQEVKSILVVMSVFSLFAGFLMCLLIVGQFGTAMLLNGSAAANLGRRGRKNSGTSSSGSSSSLFSVQRSSIDIGSTSQPRLTTLLAGVRNSWAAKPDPMRASCSISSSEEIGSGIYQTLQGIADLRDQYGDDQVSRLVNKFVAEVPEFDLKRLAWFSDMLAYNLLGHDHRQPKGITLPSFVSRRPSWPPREDDEEKPDVASAEDDDAKASSSPESTTSGPPPSAFLQVMPEYPEQESSTSI